MNTERREPDSELVELAIAREAGAPDGADENGDQTASHPAAARWRVVAVAAVAALAVVVAAAVLWQRRSAPAPAPATAPAPPSPAAAPAEATALAARPAEAPLPPGSQDELVRRLAATVSRHPEFVRWLANDQLVQRFTAVVANIANDEDPAVHLSFLRARSPFRARQVDGSWRLDERSYRRFDLLVAAIDAIDAAAAARVFAELRPQIDRAWRELGYGGEFEPVLARAIDRLLAVEWHGGDEPALEPAGLRFRYADPRLEALAPAQRHLLRLGRRHGAVVQTRLRALASALPGGVNGRAG